ncbi:NlpC/P60 family protein [Litorimonas haliclonae]|uniref:C40 family peptidase n=1 Tax=Litorimonas haliclonae TaxID=2081977 RepID=UPI0039F0EE99
MADSRISLPEAQAPLLSTAHIISSSAPLRDNRGWRKGLQTELLHGQRFNIYGEGRGWVFGQAIPLIAGSERPGYVGYIPKKSISGDPFEPSHSVSALRAPVFNNPDIKSHITQFLPLNAQVQGGKEEGDFIEVGVGAFIHSRHLKALSNLPSGQDYVDFAEMYLGAPYVWGGTGDKGLDCSGLLQMALCAVGRDAPRDADMQEQDLGERLKTTGETDELRRGDLIFWPGHIGIMSDEETLLHANAFHMITAKEPYDQAVNRIGTPRSIKRF